MEKWIYKNNADNTARFVLGTEGDNPLIIMSVNPSVGSPTQDSSTIGSIRHICAYYNYDSWIILCLYPQRATHDASELAEVADPALVQENITVIKDVLAKYPGAKIWAAWGGHIHNRYYLAECLREIAPIAQSDGDTWMHYGPLLESGDPRYPLYIEPGEGFYPFNMTGYLETLSN